MERASQIGGNQPNARGGFTFQMHRILTVSEKILSLIENAANLLPADVMNNVRTSMATHQHVGIYGPFPPAAMAGDVSLNPRKVV